MGRHPNDNAARVDALGAGIYLTLDANVAALRIALVTLLKDPSFARPAKMLGETCRHQMMSAFENLHRAVRRNHEWQLRAASLRREV
jgi:UDP:flavonoid glycosyltransferase YjiC (YdhE family)